MLNADLADIALQNHVRSLIAMNMLPTARAAAVWGGPGSGNRCTICGLFIQKSEIEFDLQFKLPSGPLELHVHQRCHVAWQRELASG